MKMKLVAVMALIAFPFIAYAQEKVVPLKYGNMDQWVTRKIHESGVIGGDTKFCLLYTSPSPRD